MAKLISYAQNFEDVILWRALSHVSNGCYVDVGAQSPDTDSVSRMFYEHGWRGVHVEPAPQYAELLRKRRPDEIVLQAAVNDRPGILQFFGIADTGLSTIDAAMAEMHRAAGYQVAEMQVPAVTLDAVFEQVKNDEIHWLKIDVEGAEHKVIDGWNAEGPMPWLLVIEGTRPLSAEQSHERWEPAVIARGYEFVYFDGLNRFYVSHQHPELKAAFGAGPNVFDDFTLSPGSQFCALVNLRFHDLEAQVQERQRTHETELRDLRVQLDAQSANDERWQAEAAELITQVESAKREANRWWTAHEELHEQMQVRAVENERQRTEISALVAQLDASKQEAHRWWSAHETLRAQFDDALQDLREHRDAAAAENERQRIEITALSAEVEAGRLDADRWRESHEDMRQQLDARASEIERQQTMYASMIDTMVQAQQRMVAEHNAALARASERAQQELAELAAQIDADKHEAHRWWLAHEELRWQLHAIEQSRSWRWTRPLRTARFRVATRPVLWLKHTLRPPVISSIKAVLAAPWLHRLLKPVVAKVPFVYDRLHALATHERLYDDGGPLPEIELRLPLILEGNEREYTVVYLDKRAARVLEDLKQVKNGKTGQCEY